MTSAESGNLVNDKIFVSGAFRTDLPLTIILLSLCFFSTSAIAQNITEIPKDSSYLTQKKVTSYYKNQRDLIDYTMLLFGKNPDSRFDTSGLAGKKLHISASPIVEYSLSTGFTSGFTTSGAFLTAEGEETKISTILFYLKYTQKKQLLLPIQSSIWTPDNKYNFLGDLRFLHYPQDTYGFGGFTTPADVNTVTYEYIRLYEYGLRTITRNLLMGLGYQLDYHWGIRESNVPAGRLTDFKKYGYSNNSLSSGLALDILYDSRKNSLNPEGGSMYGNVELLQDSKLLGANSNWNSILIDLRKYIALPHQAVLAFWSYNVFTLSGNPPYLDLPGTEADSYNNSGRGYEMGRFIGKKMVDLETELRFGITHNGFLGGVLFVNAESLSELKSNRFETIDPGFGAGLRLKFNKFSNTNICIDYGFGIRGSRGFFGNLGEVF
jgi:hypothetical protein